MGVLTEDKESSPSHGASTCAAKKKIPLPSVGKVTGMKRGGSAKGEGDKGSKVLSRLPLSIGGIDPRKMNATRLHVCFSPSKTDEMKNGTTQFKFSCWI